MSEAKEIDVWVVVCSEQALVWILGVYACEYDANQDAKTVRRQGHYPDLRTFVVRRRLWVDLSLGGNNENIS